MYWANRYSMVAICSRVMGLLGAKVVALVPLTMSLAAAQATASAYQAPLSTSVKALPPDTAGSFSSR